MGPATSKTPKHDEAVLSPPPNLAPYLATTIIIPDGWTQGIRNPDQDRMEVGGWGGGGGGGRDEIGWKTVRSRKRALSICPTDYSHTGKKNKNHSGGSGASLDSSESTLTYLKNYALPPCPSPIFPKTLQYR